MALPNFTDQKIQDTYQRVVQKGENGQLFDGTGSLIPLQIDGSDLIVSGAVKAQSYIVSESVIVVTSGSTVFGNSTDDIHQFTGSLNVFDSLTANEYKLHFVQGLGGTTAPVDVIRLEGNALTFGPDSGDDNFNNEQLTNTIISGSTIRLHSEADIITDIGGNDFRINKSDTEFFRFNLDTDPKIDATGDIIIDPSGGDMHLHGSDLTVTGSINASGDINGTIDGGTF